MWIKLYDSSNKWKLSDKKELKNTLGIMKENLGIKSLSKSDGDDKKIMDIEKNKYGEKISNIIKILENELEELESRLEYYSGEKIDENTLMNQMDTDDDMDKIKLEIDGKKNKLQEYKEKNDKLSDKFELKHITEKLDIIEKEKLLKSTGINWDKYQQIIINNLKNDYWKILKIINEKISNTKSISNFLLKIIEQSGQNVQIFNKYFEYVFTNIFDDYWDLDRYENSNYNILNMSIINILKTNIICPIHIELSNKLVNYLGQIVKKDSKVNLDKTSNESIEQFLYNGLITKLQLKNPDYSSYPDIEMLKNNIIQNINSGTTYKLDPNQIEKIKKIIDFYKLTCDELGKVCHEEITKILYDCKKISIYCKMGKLLKN
jgi:hypothetical protein